MTPQKTQARRDKERHSVASRPRRLTLGRLFAVFHRFEVNGGHGTHHLHGLSFHQAGVPSVPPGPLEVQASDKHSLLDRKGGEV